MFNVGSGELLVLLLLGLLVLGPERLPKAMGQVGRYVAQMRKLSSGFQDEIKRAIEPHDAPFRPGEERLRPANVADEVRVVGGEPADDEPADDEPADDDDPAHEELRLPDDEDEVPFRPAGPVDEAEGEPSEQARDDESDPSTAPTDPSTAPTDPSTAPTDPSTAPTDNVTPLRGRDDGDARAAG